MPGLPTTEEITRAFEGMDLVPGSKKKRRELNPKEERRRAGETNGWDANPIKKTLGGKETEVFTISALAAALEKSIVTIRSWEAKKFIPKSPYRLRAHVLQGKKTSGNRVYTRALIQSAVDEFQKRGLIGSTRVEWNQHEDLKDALRDSWKIIVATESQKASQPKETQ